MRLTNATHYSTRDLRRFFRAGLLALGGKTDKRIDVDYCRRTGVHDHDGHATLSTGMEAASWMRFGLPRDPAKLNLGALARVLRHEQAHNLGLRHREMDDELRYCTGPDPAWIAGLSIGVKAAPAKPTSAERVQQRAEHAARMLARAERRLKIAAGVAKRWRRRVAYYSRRVEVAA